MGDGQHRAILGRGPIWRLPSVTLLETIHDPAQLRALDYAGLEQLAAELREKMIRTVQHTGGHLASSPPPAISSAPATPAAPSASRYAWATPPSRAALRSRRSTISARPSTPC